MADISQGMLDKFQTFRKARRKDRAGRTLQAVGGFGGSFRGDGGAAFARLDPDNEWLEKRGRFLENMREQAGMAERVAGQEQFYFNQEQQERLSALSDIQAEMQRLSQIASTDASLAQSGAQARANLQGQALLREAMLANDELQQALGFTTQTKQAIASLERQGMLPKVDRRAAEDKHVGAAIIAAAGANPAIGRMLEEQLIVQDPATGQAVPAPGVRASDLAASLGMEKEDLAPLQMLGRKEAAQETQAQMQAAAGQGGLDAAITSILEDPSLPDHQKNNFVVSIGAEDRARELAGVDPSGLSEWDKIQAAADSQKETAQAVVDAKMHTYVTTAGKTFGGRVDKYLGDLPGLMERYQMATDMAKQNSPLQGQDTDGDGIPDIDWEPSAEGRFIQILDRIEEYPNLPPVQEAKQQIMESPEFKQFQERYGFQNADFAFKQMNKLTRAKRKQGIRADRKLAQGLKRNRVGAFAALPSPGFTPTEAVQGTAGEAPSPEPAPKPKKTDAEDLVTGTSGSRIAEN